MSLQFFTRINKSFSARVITYLFGAMVLITGTFTFFFLQSQHRYLESEIVKDGRVLTGIAANTVRLGIFAKDQRLIAESLKTAIGVEGVVGACAYDMDGQLIYREAVQDWEASRICLQGQTLSLDLRNQLKDSSQVLHFENQKTMDFWRSVLVGPQQFTEEMLYFGDGDKEQPGKVHLIGFVGVVFDKGPIQKSIQAILIKNILILLFFLCLGCVVAYYIVQGATKPLNELIASVKSQGSESGAKDEVGILSDTFSKMVGTLGESFETISKLKQGLERKVDELESEIARRRQIESNLRESEEKFRNISEGIADGVAVIINGKFVWHNKAFSTIFACQTSELVDCEAKVLLPELSDIQGSFNGKEKQVRYLVEARKKDNQKITVDVNAQKIVFEKHDAIQVIIRDITESVEAEKKRKTLEVQAFGQSKLAALGKIATSVAHEINQPLSYIKISYESILQDMENNRFDKDETKGYCKESLRQVDRITLITDHLRSFGRTDTSLFSEIRIPDVLANSLTLMKESLRLADITLIQEIDENLPFVIGNSVKFEQVFINLLQNSIDAMIECIEKKILITMRQAGTMVEICFSDSGPGIKSDIFENIFEPFFTTKKLEDRTGLGLGIVNNIVKEHRGTIEYRPREGWGAHFVILLPASK